MILCRLTPVAFGRFLMSLMSRSVRKALPHKSIHHRFLSPCFYSAYRVVNLRRDAMRTGHGR